MSCPTDPDEPATTPLRAAAVPYRRRNDHVELLLVRTRTGRAWTIPKGHIERGETTRDAALREAREEAGVTGEIEARPFTRYRYQVTDGRGVTTVVCVEAYLLGVESEVQPAAAEGMRAPQWFGPEDAIEKLSADRDPQWTREHRRLVEEAVSRLVV